MVGKMFSCFHGLQAWLEQFPLTFDTRFVAQEGRLQVFKHLGALAHCPCKSSVIFSRSMPVFFVCHCFSSIHFISFLSMLRFHWFVLCRLGAGGLTLDALRSQLRGQSNLKVQRCDESTAPGSTHSGGYDATVTAEVFLLELDIWIRFQQRKKQERQEKQAAAENPQNAENAKTLEDGENATQKAKNVEKAENEGNEVVSQESGGENGQKEAKQNSGETQENHSIEERGLFDAFAVGSMLQSELPA